jgi:hypothetical protein
VPIHQSCGGRSERGTPRRSRKDLAGPGRAVPGRRQARAAYDPVPVAVKPAGRRGERQRGRGRTQPISTVLATATGPLAPGYAAVRLDRMARFCFLLAIRLAACR